jgi:hypothetical protein
MIEGTANQFITLEIRSKVIRGALTFVLQTQHSPNLDT